MSSFSLLDSKIWSVLADDLSSRCSLYSRPITHFRCRCRNLRSCWQLQIWEGFYTWTTQWRTSAFVALLKTYLRRERSLYCSAHCADRELCLIGHDVGGLDVAVIHGVLEGRPSVCVLVTRVTIEGNFGSFSESKDKCRFFMTHSHKEGYFSVHFLNCELLYLCL